MHGERKGKNVKFSNFLITIVFPIKRRIEKCHSTGKNQLSAPHPRFTYSPTQRLLSCPARSVESAMLPVLSPEESRQGTAAGVMKGNIQYAPISTFPFSCFSDNPPSPFSESDSSPDFSWITSDLWTTTVFLKMDLSLGWLSSQKQNPEMFEPLHFVWAFSYRTVSAAGFWVKTHLPDRLPEPNSVCTPPTSCSQTVPYGAFQLVAMFVRVLQSMLLQQQVSATAPFTGLLEWQVWGCAPCVPSYWAPLKLPDRLHRWGH